MKHIILSFGIFLPLTMMACSKSNETSQTVIQQTVKTIKEYEQADFAIVERDAKQGIATAQTVYGLMHFWGVDGKLEKDPPKGLEWLQKAVDQNEPEAIYQLGQLYLPPSPLGVVTPNIETAHTLLYQAANMNHVHAQYFVGLGAWLGAHGFKRDLNEAKQWFSKAAENGHEMAQTQLKMLEK